MPEASTKLVTQKSLSDFKKLHQNLHRIHKSLHLSGHLPSIGRHSLFKKTEEEHLRRQCLDLLESASQHPQLYNSQVFLNFFATLSPTSSLELDIQADILDAGQANQKVRNLILFIFCLHYFEFPALFLRMAVKSAVNSKWCKQKMYNIRILI